MAVLIWPSFIIEIKLFPAYFAKSHNPLLIKTENSLNKNLATSTRPVVSNATSAPEVLPKETKTETEKKESTDLIYIDDVPFTPQAPFAEWEDERFQDGCEEASVLMAMSWVFDEKLSREEAKSKIIEMSAFEKEKFGSFKDTSATDTAIRLIYGTYNYKNYEVKNNIEIGDIVDALSAGNLVIAPFDGRALKNPYYTPPGPERHMLVIRGYDKIKKEFITNDGGTRRGENYRYKEKILYDAIRDYPTGEDIPINEIQKNIIIIKKGNQ